MWLIFFLGMVGGVANSLLLSDGFELPRLSRETNKPSVWRPGFIGNLFLGGIAALVTHLLGASQLQYGSQLGIALLSGVGGGNVLTSLLQKQEAGLLKIQRDTLEATVQRLSKGTEK